jgi:hypothetical protein
MMFVSWNWRTWLLLALGCLALIAYFGILSSVDRMLEQAGTKAAIERLANQPQVKHLFNAPFEGRIDAYMVIVLFLLVSPIALVIAVTLALLVLFALATALAPLMGGEKAAMLVLEGCAALVIYVERDVWMPHVAYFVGLLARAVVTVTA